MRNDSNRQLVHIVAASLVVAALLSAAAAGRGIIDEDGDGCADPSIWLKIDLPQPQFVCTPRPLPKSPCLQPQLESRRKALIVPGEVKLISRGKPVASSLAHGPIIGDLEQITDGDKQTTDGSCVIVDFEKQWVQIDLEEDYEIHAIALWHYFGVLRIYRDVIVQASNDEKFRTGVVTLFNNDQDNSYGLGVGKDHEYLEENYGKLIAVDGVKARYLRFHSNGSSDDDQNHYIEIEVFGHLPKQNTNTGTDNKTRATK